MSDPHSSTASKSHAVSRSCHHSTSLSRRTKAALLFALPDARSSSAPRVGVFGSTRAAGILSSGAVWARPRAENRGRSRLPGVHWWLQLRCIRRSSRELRRRLRAAGGCRCILGSISALWLLSHLPTRHKAPRLPQSDCLAEAKPSTSCK